jgi:hypothetical protein
MLLPAYVDAHGWQRPLPATHITTAHWDRMFAPIQAMYPLIEDDEVIEVKPVKPSRDSLPAEAKCVKCKQTKPAKQFNSYLSLQGTYRFKSWCKACNNERNKLAQKVRIQEARLNASAR